MFGQDLRQRDQRQSDQGEPHRPGATATRMRAEAYPGEDQATLPTPADVAESFVALAMPDCSKTGQIIEADRPN